MEEEWKIYKEAYSTRWKHRIYEVSNLGRVKINGELINFDDTHKGYYTIGHFYIHKAVAELFIPNPENKPNVDHLDCDKHNNIVNNLKWVTHKENMNNPITIQRNRESHLGMPSAFKGRHHTEEAKKAMSEQRKGRHHTEESKKKMSEGRKGEKNAFYGKHHTEETKKKISEKAKLRKGYWKGKKLSEETKEKIRLKRIGKHRVYHEDGTYHYEK